MKYLSKRAWYVLMAMMMTSAVGSASAQTLANEGCPLFQALALPDVSESTNVNQSRANILPVNHSSTIVSDGEEVVVEAGIAIEDQFLAMQQRLAELEAGLHEVAEGTGDKTIVHSGSSKSTMKISGRVHVDAWGFDPTGGNVPLLNEKDGLPIDPKNRLGFGVCGLVSMARSATT